MKSDVVLVDLHVVHFLEDFDEAVGAIFGATVGNVHREELVSLGHAGEGDAHLLALIKSDTEVLNEMFDVETGFKVSLQNARAEAGKLEGASSTLGEELDHLVQVKTSLLTVDKSLANTEQVVGNHDLVGSLSVLTSASLAHKLNLSGVHVE